MNKIATIHMFSTYKSRWDLDKHDREMPFSTVLIKPFIVPWHGHWTSGIIIDRPRDIGKPCSSPAPVIVCIKDVFIVCYKNALFLTLN
jgi:hypothetical protein